MIRWRRFFASKQTVVGILFVTSFVFVALAAHDIGCIVILTCAFMFIVFGGRVAWALCWSRRAIM